MKSMLPDFVSFYSGYGSYHHNPVNKTIHIFCIPLILMSAVQLLQHATFRIQSPLIDINFPFLALLILSTVYISVDYFSGVISSSFYLVMYFVGNHYFKSLDTQEELDYHFKVALVVHIVSWILQFIGHGVFEKRAPALLDNILQVFVAPDFVIIELLFMMGYNPQVREKCDLKISENIRKFHKLK